MLGRVVDNATYDTSPPEWAVKLLATVDPRIRLKWKTTMNADTRFGTCAQIERRTVVIWFPREETTEARWMLLHEAAHVVAGRNRELVRGRKSEHGPAFCAVALRLYSPYPEVVEFAKGHEYICVRRYIVENTGGVWKPRPRFRSAFFPAPGNVAPGRQRGLARLASRQPQSER